MIFIIEGSLELFCELKEENHTLLRKYHKG